MFVTQGRYDKLLAEKCEYQVAYAHIIARWNILIDKINAKGGEEFLESEPANSAFSNEEIKTLINLCHPDKHSGKKSATDITAKLLDMKGRAGC